jgi:hypothetical protein
MFYPTNEIQLRDIKSNANGTTATIDCTKGPRYRKITIGLRDTGKGDANAPAIGTVTAGDWSVILGSKQIRQFTGAQLDYLNTQNGAQYGSYGVAGVANGSGVTYVTIYFDEPWRKRADFQNGLSCETGWLGSDGVFQIKVPLDGTGTTKVIDSVFAVVDGYSSGAPNAIMKYYASDAGTSAATLEMANLFLGADPDDLVESITLFDPSDSVAQSKQVIKARLNINGNIVIDDITNDQMIVHLKQSDMNPTVGAYNIVFDHDDLFESLRQIKSIRSSQLTLTFKAASAGTLRRIVQRLGDPTKQ